jgi:hypothetical protein
MDPTDYFPAKTFWQKDSFHFIKPEEFEALGIDQTDIPLGTFASLKRPSHLPSRFGGDAYGFGLFEVYDRLKQKDMKFLQSITLENPEHIKKHYKRLNELYKKIGLLIRFSRHGTPYYLIPTHLISNTLTHIKSKVDEITKIVGFHRKKYLKEQHEIGVLSNQDDLVLYELSFRFKEHRFVAIDSLEKLQHMNSTLDLFILPRDLYEIILMEEFSSISNEIPSRKRLDQYAIYIIWKLYNLLKPNGEIFIMADYHPHKTNRATKLVFKTTQEEKNFTLFSHIFKTKKRYKTKNRSLQTNIFDFQKYLSGLYVEQEVLDRLLKGKGLEHMTLEQIKELQHLDFELTDWPLLSNQGKIWSKLLSIFFDEIFLKPLVPQSVKDDWKKRFSSPGYSPQYMVIYLGQKKPLKTTISEVRREVVESRLMGCPTNLLADYRDSFEYVIRTLRVLDKLRTGDYKGQPQLFIDRLKQPLEHKNRRFSTLNDVIKLITKINRLEKVKDYLNPDKIEGSKTKVLKNLEALTFFGFSRSELKEIVYIVLGHTPMGRIISGKMNEKALKPLSDLARGYDPQQALNLLRYCLLMTMAETEAARKTELTHEEFSELFDLYESTLRVITSRELDWDRLLDEKISSMGGIHNKIVRKLLKMINHFEFIGNWSELRQKGQMEKEALADYDDRKLSRVENVIKLVNTVEEFEEMYLKFDPLQLPVFYRKFLNIEFHGTGHLFERMDSQNVFILLWITVNLARGDIINFNPILADVETAEIDDRVKKAEEATRDVNVHNLDLTLLRRFSEQLYKNRSAFIVGTGFHLREDPETQGLEIGYIDMNKNIKQLESLSKKLAGSPVSEIPVEDLTNLEYLFSNLQSFYQWHLTLVNQADPNLRLPAKQNEWFEKAQDLREYLRANFLNVIFRPEHIYTDLDLLYYYAPSLLNFILPEFTSLENLDLSWHLYLRSPVPHYIISNTKKIQALIRHDRESFQDTELFHRLAQREFGPMATGIVGVNESQIEDLEEIVEKLSHNKSLFDALVRSFIFQDIGRALALREKYKSDLHPVDLAIDSALFIEQEKIAERYHLDEKGKAYLLFLVKYHGLFHHIIRGEFSFSAIREVLKAQDKNLFDAFFVLSFIMLSSIREDLILEDLAGWLFRIRTLCHKIIDGETTLEEQLSKTVAQKGDLSYAFEIYQKKGPTKGVTSAHYLEIKNLEKPKRPKSIRAGKRIFAMERLFRLHGIRYAEFLDLANLILKVPLKFIHKKRRFSSIGYATFEKEVYEAFRIYNNLQNLPENTRHFILDRLMDDKVRIFGYEKVSGYLSYENQIKLLLTGLLGAKKLKPNGLPICINFLSMSKKIEKRYEAINDYLNSLSIEKLWEDNNQLSKLFKAKTGLVLRKDEVPNVLSLDFNDRVNISQKISYMNTIDNVEQLKNYFHSSLRSFRKDPFYTDDYELQLEKAFEKRLSEITDMLLNQTRKQMDLMKDFLELHNLVSDLLERSLDIGFSDDQKHRLNDLYELRKDGLKRDKLYEIDRTLDTIHDIHELNVYWDSIKWYLQSNRRFFGKEFENIIAEKFDKARIRIEGSWADDT